MELYKTIRNSGDAELLIEKSRFIAHVIPVDNRQDADDFIETIKKQYKDATHNVPAMVIGDKQQIQWASDDGEPQGTSGPPIVQMLVNEGISNIALVVTRYFGGIKLGTGGLVRAYTNAAKQAIENAGICSVKETFLLKAEIEYSYLSKFQNMEKDGLYLIDKIEYGEKVIMSLLGEIERSEAVLELIKNVTAGTGNVFEQSRTISKV